MENTNALRVTYNLGDKLKFAEERRWWTVRGVSQRYIICTRIGRGSNKGTKEEVARQILYTILDLKTYRRGAHDLIFNIYDFDSQEGIEELLNDLKDKNTHLSASNNVPICITGLKKPRT